MKKKNTVLTLVSIFIALLLTSLLVLCLTTSICAVIQKLEKDKKLLAATERPRKEQEILCKIIDDSQASERPIL